MRTGSGLHHFFQAKALAVIASDDLEDVSKAGEAEQGAFIPAVGQMHQSAVHAAQGGAMQPLGQLLDHRLKTRGKGGDVFGHKDNLPLMTIVALV